MSEAEKRPARPGRRQRQAYAGAGLARPMPGAGSAGRAGHCLATLSPHPSEIWRTSPCGALHLLASVDIVAAEDTRRLPVCS